MYFSRQQPPEGGARALRALHVSLNAPVVAIEDLPVGPARAAIALQDAPDGGASLLLALRSQRTGQLACFAPDEPLTETTAQIALDGALSFAESMGFLFDGDVIPELGAEGPREAAESWNQLLGVAPEPEPEPGRAPAENPAEIWLEEAVAPPAPAAQAAAEPQTAGDSEPETAPAPPAALLLTKFRRTTGASGRNGWPIRLLSNF
jgi:hypothetical protein